MKSLSDADRYGFKTSDIYSFLEEHGLTLSSVGDSIRSTTEPAATTPAIPEWKHLMAALPALTVSEVCHAFANVDPHARGHLSDEEHAEVARYESLIKRAILVDDASEKLATFHIEFDGHGRPTQSGIKPAVLAAWCLRKGLSYPLPATVHLLPTNTDAVAEIDRLKAEISALKAERVEFANLPSTPVDWMLPYKGRHQISFADVAAILAGLEPAAPNEVWADEAWARVIKWREALGDAIENGEIDTGPWRICDDAEPPALFQSDIREWCAKRGYLWPIPDPNPLPERPDAELIERLRVAEAEHDDLVHRLRVAEAEIARLKSIEETPGYRDITHDRYAPKLAAAIDAWESVTNPQGKHPKQALVQWLTENAAKLGLWDKDKPNKTAIEEAAKVANWQERGGAPRTPGK